MRKDKAHDDANAWRRLIARLPRALGANTRLAFAAMAAAMLAMAPAVTPAGAQDVQSFDPDEAFENASQAAQDGASGAIDADLVDPSLRDARDALPTAPPSLPDAPVPVNPQGSVPAAPGFDDEFSEYAQTQTGDPVPEWSDPVPADQAGQTAAADPGTYGEDDLIGAAEGVFGKGAQGLAGMIENLLREQGEPNGYIVGREAGGAFIFGARYGSGTLHHKIEGERKVYWTGPSLGIDAGANAGNTFVLVYNLYDSEDIFRRYPAGEGQAYFVGGLHASYMRRGDVVLIPIRVGAGLRLGINAGYMRFSKKHRWLPF